MQSDHVDLVWWSLVWIMSRKYIAILLTLASLSLCSLLAGRARGVSTTWSLFPGESYTQECVYSEKTDIDIQDIRRTQLVVYMEPEALEFESELPCSVYIVNETEFIAGNASNWASFTPGKSWINQTRVYDEISFEKITSTPAEGGWGMPVTLQVLAGQEPVNTTTFHVVVINEAAGNNSFILRYQEKIPFLQFIHDFTYNLIIVLFFTFAVLLVVESRRVAKENPIRGNILMNYGAGLAFGGIGTGAWEFWHWISHFVPSNAWADYLAFQGMPAFLPFSPQTLSFVTFTALGFSLVFMSWTVERSVQNRKMPFLTYFLLANQGALILGMFLPVLLYVVLFTWIGSLALVAVNIAIAYIKAARLSSGQLRKKSLFILLGLLLTFTFIVLRDYIRPNFIGNFVVIVFMVILYKGLKMER